MKSFRTLVLQISVVALVLIAPAGASAASQPQLVTAYDHVCTISDAGGPAICWGYNGDGELGRGIQSASEAPGPVTSTSGYTKVAAAANATCVVNAAATVSCWGWGVTGVLGNGSAVAAAQLTPVSVLNVAAVTDIWGGSDGGAFCAKQSDASIWCWGRNGHGQFGNGSTSLAVSTPIEVPALKGVVKVAMAGNSICGLFAHGAVSCSGSDLRGQLGDGGGGDSRSTFAAVPGLTGVTDLVGNSKAVCALLGDGSVKCWGEDSTGLLGDGPDDEATAYAPQTVPGLTGITSLGSSYYVFCAAKLGVDMWCWGDNDDGSAGIGATTPSPVVSPTQVPGTSDIVLIAQGDDSDPTCAMRRGGGVICWGYNVSSVVGINTGGEDVLSPIAVPVVDLVTLAYPGTGTTAGQPLKPKADKKGKTYKLTTSLTTTPNILVAPAEACTGPVTAKLKYSYYKYKTVKKNGKKKRKRFKVKKTITGNGALALSGTGCVSTIALKLPVKYLYRKTVKVTLSASGNGSLQPVSAVGTYKLPKVKLKCKKGYKQSGAVCKKKNL